MAYTQAEIDTMTPAEQEVARSMNAAEEAGEDLFGDGETAADTDTDDAPADTDADSEGGTTDEAEEIPGDKVEDKPADDKPAETEAATEEEPAAAEAEPEADPVLQFKGEAPADVAQQIADLRKERLAARKKWSAGEIDEDELDALESPIEDTLAELQRQQTVAETMAEAARQQQKHEEERAVREAMRFVDKLRGDAKKEGIDYGTAKEPTEAAYEFDRQRQALALDPKWQKKSFAEQAARAHEIVVKLHGKPAAAAPAPAAARRAAPAAPTTLRELPAADRANAGGDLEDQWKAATGAAADRLWAKLTPAQQSRLLDE